MRAEFMPKEQNHTYEKLYYTYMGSLLAVTAAFASFAQWETAMMTG
ncbi:MAG: hypothetical protein ACLU6Y_15925 [Ruminococcus sp.]